MFGLENSNAENYASPIGIVQNKTIQQQPTSELELFITTKNSLNLVPTLETNPPAEPALIEELEVIDVSGHDFAEQENHKAEKEIDPHNEPINIYDSIIRPAAPDSSSSRVSDRVTSMEMRSVNLLLQIEAVGVTKNTFEPTSEITQQSKEDNRYAHVTALPTFLPVRRAAAIATNSTLFSLSNEEVPRGDVSQEKSTLMKQASDAVAQLFNHQVQSEQRPNAATEAYDKERRSRSIRRMLSILQTE